MSQPQVPQQITVDDVLLTALAEPEKIVVNLIRNINVRIVELQKSIKELNDRIEDVEIDIKHQKRLSEQK